MNIVDEEDYCHDQIEESKATQVNLFLLLE